MPSPNSTAWPQADDGTVAVAAPTLQDAYRRVKREYGDDAVILGSRAVTRRQAQGLGRERKIEVIVQTRPGAVIAPPPGGTPTSDADAQVRRIEGLVTAIEQEHARLRSLGDDLRGNPLAASLLDAGAGSEAVGHCLARFRGETGCAADDRPALLAWLEDNLPASNTDWDGFYGCHAFLGETGCGRSDLVLATAARLQAAGRRTLALSVLPAHRGEARRLQTAASAGNFDAAVVNKPDRLAATEAQLADYDAVLVDLPRLADESMAPGSPLHTWLAGHEGFHRHLVLPLDGDARDQAELVAGARAWNCDWVALSRTDRSRRWGKIIDLERSFGLPFSLVSADPARGGAVDIASSGTLMDHILGAGAFVAGLEVAARA